MDMRNIHCQVLTVFTIIACVAMGSALAFATVSQFTGWDYVSFGIIAAIVTSVCLTVTTIELMMYQFDGKEKEG